jgi:hypothetical protein
MGILSIMSCRVYLTRQADQKKQGLHRLAAELLPLTLRNEAATDNVCLPLGRPVPIGKAMPPWYSNIPY